MESISFILHLKGKHLGEFVVKKPIKTYYNLLHVYTTSDDT